MAGGKTMKFKTLLIILAVLAGTTAHAADRVKAKATTDLLNTFVTKSQSTTPDRSLFYESDRDDVDNHRVEQALTIAIDSVNNKVTINRIDTQDYTACTSDYGSVTIVNTSGARKLEIASDRLPLRVFCTNLSGKMRGFFTTYKE